MARKKERPVYAFRRRGNSLVPEMEYDLRALDGIPQNERVKIDISEWRSLGRLRAYWKMLHECVEATECALNAETLHEAVKLSTGHVQHVRLKSGLTVAVPASIAFDKMSEAEMVSFFRQAEMTLARDYGFVREEMAA